jgi:hypothetical protein
MLVVIDLRTFGKRSGRVIDLGNILIGAKRALGGRKADLGEQIPQPVEVDQRK